MRGMQERERGREGETERERERERERDRETGREGERRETPPTLLRYNPQGRHITPCSTLRKKSTEKAQQNISGQQFAQTFRTQGSTEVLYSFSVVFSTVLWRPQRR